MACIPDDQIERPEAEVSLVRLVEARGVVHRKHGKDWLGRCPFHDDKTPSLVVSPALILPTSEGHNRYSVAVEGASIIRTLSA
jgi:hypothetical protein